MTAGRSAAWLARLPWEQEVDGSNPFAPTNKLSHLGGSQRPAFFHVHMNVHTEAVWSATLEGALIVLLQVLQTTVPCFPKDCRDRVGVLGNLKGDDLGN